MIVLPLRLRHRQTCCSRAFDPPYGKAVAPGGAGYSAVRVWIVRKATAAGNRADRALRRATVTMEDVNLPTRDAVVHVRV